MPKSIQQSDVRLRMNYIGVMTLLGELSRDLPKFDSNRYGIDKAMRDANNWLLVNKSDIVYVKDNRGGWSAFERSKLLDTEKQKVSA